MRETSVVEKLIKNTPLAIFVIGVILFVIGAAGGWPNPPLHVYDWRWQIALGVMGVLTAGFGGLSYWRERTRKSGEDSHETYGIEISSPSNGDAVGENFIVEGKYDVKPPDGVDVVVLEVSPKSGLYYPKTNKVFFDEKRKTWKTASISIALTRLLQLVTFCFRTIKSWSGFADDFWSPNSKCSAKNASFLLFLLLKC